MNEKTNTKENPVLYVVLNGELNMSPGKAAAQAVHAAMLLEDNYPGLFVSNYKRTVVTLEAENGETIKNLLEYLQGAGIFAAYYIDEKSEKGKPYQVTALAIEPIDHDDTEKRSILESFGLFGKDKNEYSYSVVTYLITPVAVLVGMIMGALLF
jgi:peptidyl-tRNA hydrolase